MSRLKDAQVRAFKSGSREEREAEAAINQAKLARFNADVPEDLLHRVRVKAASRRETFRELAVKWLNQYLDAE